MKRYRITLHYTAGTTRACDIDLERYHFITDREGLKKNSKGFTPRDNIDCYDGSYVAHCRGSNTNNIGHAIAGYYQYEKGFNIPSRETFELYFSKTAMIMFVCGVDIKDVYTHAELNDDKIDFIYLPDYWGVGEIKGRQQCADFIRKKVKWYYDKLQR